MDTQFLLREGENEDQRDANRRAVLSSTGSSSRSWLVNPRFWALAIGIFVVIVSIILIVVLVTVPRNGRNINQVRKIQAAALSSTVGYNRLGYASQPSLSYPPCISRPILTLSTLYRYMLDTYGPRICGSAGLNNSLTWMAQAMAQDGFVCAFPIL